MQLVIEHVSKQYHRNVWGLHDVSLEVGPGVLGLLGPNGAGKSTLMRIIATITRPSSGRVLWNGQDIALRPNHLREVLGYLPQDFGVYPHLNATEFLTYLAAVKGLEHKAARQRIDELLQVVNLVDVRKRPLGGYSGGMKQRIGIAQALLNDPQLLIVDEPTVGLDPEERVQFRTLLADLAGSRVVILSTHIVSDVEAAATDLVILYGGGILIQSTPEALLQRTQGKVWEWMIPSRDLPEVRARYHISAMLRRDTGVQVRLLADSAPDRTARQVEPGLEDAYLYHISLPAMVQLRSEAV
jgi:ABC-type multidrug transport system ATPase subunit